MNNVTSTPNLGKLIISRHTESEWNALGKWTGLTDISVSDNGVKQAAQLGELVKDIDLSVVYTSVLKRTKETADEILKITNQTDVERHEAPELNERDYGDLTAKDKWEVKLEIGEEKFNAIRRGWNEPVPGGETLKDVYARSIPYFEKEILPRLKTGENVLIVAHGNTIRSLRKYLENISDEDIAGVEMALGTLMIYGPNQENPDKLNVIDERHIEIANTKA